MGYCCGEIGGVTNVVGSKDFTCLTLPNSQYKLSIQTDAARIVWFFRAVGQAIFTEVSLYENQKDFYTSQLGEYKAVVQGTNGSAIVKGSIPCTVRQITPVVTTPVNTIPTGVLVTPTEILQDTDLIMFARKDTAGQVVSYHTYPSEKYKRLVRGIALDAPSHLDGIGIKAPDGGVWIETKNNVGTPTIKK
jgi:hypothetical protein